MISLKNVCIGLLFLIFYGMNQLDAQELKSIKGKILEKEYRIPIPYVTVRLLNNNKNTISNSEGSFNLDISTATIKDTVLFTSIGYKPLKITVEFIQKGSVSEFLMTGNRITLEEVTINPILVTSILNKAVKTSNARYASPLILKGYYRELVKRDSIISKYADGLVEYYIERTKKNEPRISLKVNESRVKELPIPDDEDKFNGFNTHLDLTAMAEFISPIKASVLDSTYFKYYNYSLSEITDNGRDVYSIDFKPVIGEKEAFYEGRLYIDKQTLLIMSVDYKVAPASVKYLKSVSLFGMTIGLISKSMVLRYKLTDNQYYLSYISRSHGMKISSKKLNQQNEFKSEFVVTDAQVDNCIPFPKNITYTKRSLYKRGNKYTFDFWNNYNISPNTLEEIKFIEKN